MGCIKKDVLLLVLSLIAFSSAPGWSAIGEQAEQLEKEQNVSQDKKSAQKFISIDFDNVDIRLLINYISELTGKNFVVDKAVQGNVTIVSPAKISEDETYHVFESVLEVHGFTTVPAGAIIKIIPAAMARSKNVETLRKGTSSYPEDKIVTQLIPLKHTTPAEMKKVLTPLVSTTSVVIAHTSSGMLIISETLSNIQRLLEIIEVLDVEHERDKLVVLPLENATATSIAKVLNTVYQKKGVGKAGAQRKVVVKVVPYERVNSIIVLASTEEVARVKNLIALLDIPTERDEGNIQVFYLQNANATELAKVLNTLPGNQKGQEEKGKAPAISRDVKVMADEDTNSLIIIASREEYAVLEGVIKKLDIPRQMVYLEALIMEVNTTKQFDVGVEWGAGGLFSDDTGKLATGFSSDSRTPYGKIGGLTGDTPSLSDGFSLGIIKKGIEIGGMTFPNIAAVLRAYQNDSDINIIATPQILTTDNKKAEISVGENIPYITSQNTTSSEQDYTQYDYRDVATKLSITPQINQADTMRLDIETEIVKLKGNSLELTPTTFRRTASTTVIVNDNDTVVIGGIIGQDTIVSEVKVPFFGDIPLLGWLFKSQATKNTETNMFIFITPRIIRNPADISGVTIEKQEIINNVFPGLKEESLKSTDKKHAIDLVKKGAERMENDKVREAEEYFLEALENDPVNLSALFNMGGVHEHDGEFDQARDYYQKVIRFNKEAAVIDDDSSEKESGDSLAMSAREGINRLPIDREER